MLEGRNFIGIEKNEDTALFKRGEIDYIQVSRDRLRAAWLSLSAGEREQIYMSSLIAGFPERD